MFNPDFGWGFGHGLIAVLHMIATGFAWILFASITVGVLFLLIRFLLVATRAAQLYVAANEPVRIPPAGAAATPASAPADAAPTANAAAATEPATKPMTPTDAAAQNTVKRATARAPRQKNPPKP